ncbi:spore germination protein [Bacillus solitudinis]|uniref:spore germination protein n=1 Tax=Bacillus solitudinis TaxID=2014074 RepID=UPI000C232597|nr:spore germination protein [Bacillus solitudinis]
MKDLVGLKKKHNKHTSSHFNIPEKKLESENNQISQDIDENFRQLKEIFSNCYDLTFYSWGYGPELSHKAFSVYFESLTLDKTINYMKYSMQDLLDREVGPATSIEPEHVISFFDNNGVSAKNARVLTDFNQVISNILKGHVVIFFDMWDQTLSYDASSVESRQVSEPIAESVVQGPREGTVENLYKNIGLIRTRLKNQNLKFEVIKSGGKAQTEVAYSFFEGAVDPATLSEFKKRISQVEKVEILETSYVEEWIEDSTYSPFPQHRYSERPDVAVSALLEGKIIVLVQGTGSILICPGLFVEFFQSSEDYYQRTVISTLIRLLRIMAFFISLNLTGIYISLSTFHPELIPTVLLLAIIDSREGIPFPTVVEALVMQFFFELLREAGIRLPRPVGSAVSIVGALVIGEAAITAGIASPIIVVIVALTGIASFAIPQYTIAIPLRIIQFPLMIMAASMGLFGMMIGLIWLMLHLTNLRTLGQPYLAPLAPMRPRQLMDVFVRAPLKTLFRSPRSRYSHKQ